MRSIVIERNNPKFSKYLGRTGSSTLVRINGVNYICFAQHELGTDVDISEIRIVSARRGQLKNITFDTFFRPIGEWAKDEELKDIVLLRGYNQIRNGNPDYPYFFPVKDFDRSKIFASLIVACPFYEDNVDIDSNSGETIRFNEKTVVRDCLWNKEYNSHAKFVEQFTYIKKPEYPENGMSGGAIFSIVEDSEGLEVYLHGIITRAGNGKLLAISSEYFMNFAQAKIVS